MRAAVNVNAREIAFKESISLVFIYGAHHIGRGRLVIAPLYHHLDGLGYAAALIVVNFNGLFDRYGFAIFQEIQILRRDIKRPCGGRVAGIMWDGQRIIGFQCGLQSAGDGGEAAAQCHAWCQCLIAWDTEIGRIVIGKGDCARRAQGLRGGVIGLGKCVQKRIGCHGRRSVVVDSDNCESQDSNVFIITPIFHPVIEVVINNLSCIEARNIIIGYISICAGRTHC